MIPTNLENVTAVCKANVYFDGNVVSHTVVSSDGSKQTLGIIFPGSYQFNTGAPERMDIVAGTVRWKIAGSDTWLTVEGGSGFDVPGNSSFEIATDSISEYLCSFLA